MDFTRREFQRVAELSPGLSTVAALSHDNRTMYQFSKAPPANRFTAIVGLDLSSGTERTIFTLPGPTEALPKQGGVALALNPRGTTLALMMTNPQTRETVFSIVGIEGTGYRVIYGTADVADVPDQLTWTSDGRALLFLMTSNGSTSRLMRMRIDTERPQPEFTGLAVDDLKSLAVSQDGKRVAYGNIGRGSGQLFVLDLASLAGQPR